MITPTTNQAAMSATTASTATSGRGMDALGQGDFLRLLTVQMQQQDPFDPVDNKEMLAQMAQFSSLAGVSETNSMLEQIADKLDQLIDTTASASASNIGSGRQSMSFYTSLNGMKNAQTSLGVIAHNISNSETYGFKRSRTEFSEIVAGSALTNPRMIQGIGSSVESITQNFSLGPVEQTGSALDLAITGDGFFTTRSASDGSTLYTRSGSFSMTESGNIADSAGNRLQVFAVDANGQVTGNAIGDAQVPPVNANGSEFAGVTVTATGIVQASYADGTVEPVGAVALASFISPTGLKKVGSANWEGTGLSGAATYGSPGTGAYGSLLSGALERSNVDIAEELVGLITAQRNFQANAKAIDTATQISQTVINLRT
jgi:flagellar hook protein FlgE